MTTKSMTLAYFTWYVAICLALIVSLIIPAEKGIIIMLGIIAFVLNNIMLSSSKKSKRKK